MEQEGRMDQKENLSPYRREFAIQKEIRNTTNTDYQEKEEMEEERAWPKETYENAGRNISRRVFSL